MAAKPTSVHAADERRNSPLPAELLAKIPALIWTTDAESRFTELSGRKVEANAQSKYLGQPIETFFSDPQSSGKARDAHFLALSGENCSFDFDFDGRDFQAQVAPLHGQNRQIIGAVAIAVDQTDRIVAQRALRISERNYRLLIEEAPHAICRTTRSGNLLQANRAMQEMLGYSEGDLLIRNLQTEIFTDPTQYGTFMEKLLGSGFTQGFEAQWLGNDARKVYVSLGGRAVYDSWGELLYVDLFAENVSERKELEEQLRQAQKMQAVGQLAGGIAHDFNNLLTVIRGQAEMMSEEILCSDPLLPRLTELERAAERAAVLTRQLLAFSRKQVLQPQVFDLNGTVANMTKLLDRLLGGNIDLVFSADPRLRRVRMDPGQMEQVLMNLAVNARDAMPEGGRLTIETQNAAADVARPAGVPSNDFVLLTVRDTGHGMDEETRARVFEPFFTTKQVGKGTGLGLSVVYGVVKQSGGHVRVESESGKGTIFRIYLPATEGEAEAPVESKNGAIARGTETVLLVEDDEAIRHMLASFLHMHGYHVLVASDGQQAEKLAATWPIDLVLSDMRMPRMGGRELAAKLSQTLPKAKLILMSGHPEDPEICPEGVRFLQKPFSTHTLSGLLRELLDGTAQQKKLAAAASN